jgi:UDP-N-acetylglucosamine 2-epimerase (non-hydrolysing)
MIWPKTICVITGSRAEYGLLRWVMQGIKDDPNLTLQLIVTGTHLSPNFGMTYQEIEEDGFHIDYKIEVTSQSDTSIGVLNSMGRVLTGFASALAVLKPDMLVILGDRFEIFAAAQVAMVMQIPLAHLGGGDNGSGTYDNVMRHCITKMASLHFVTHQDARHRVIQLGERPDRVFCYGATNVDSILKRPLLPKETLERELGITFEETTFLVTFHPLTMDNVSGEDQLKALLSVLHRFQQQRPCSVIFTKSNADNGGRALNHILETFVEQNPKCHLFDSLGQTRYLSMMRHASVVVGNSSSGIYEAPYLQTPTVDIGSRQRGRSAPASVIRCEADEKSISEAILAALAFEFHDVGMIYGNGDSSSKILGKIKELAGSPGLAIKEFVDLENRK